MMENLHEEYALLAMSTSEEESVNTLSVAVEQVQHTVTWCDRTTWTWPQSEKGLEVTLKSATDVDRYLKYCEQRRVAVQAGGAVGMYPKRLAQHFDLVVTFEPNPELFQCLLDNADEASIAKIRCALSDHRHQVDLHIPDKKYVSNRGAWEVRPGSTIPADTLDSFNLEDVDLICLDVEGHEPKALKGAQETIDRYRPVVVVEYKPSILQRNDIEGWLDPWLEENSYEVAEEIGRDKVLVHV